MAGHWQLTGKTAAESAAFSRRFDSLPFELKSMIVEEAVASCEMINIPDFTRARKQLCKPFEYDSDLLEEAHKQFKRINKFALPLHDRTKIRSVRNIRHLTINHPIVVGSGDLTRFGPRYQMEPHDRATIDSLPNLFKNLETLTINVDTTAGNIALNAKFSMHGITWPAEGDTTNRIAERSFKMHGLLSRVRSLKFPQSHRNLPIKTTLILRNAETDSNFPKAVKSYTEVSRRYGRVNEYSANVCRVLDMPEITMELDQLTGLFVRK